MIQKDVAFKIRIQRDLRDEFRAVCKAQDKPASQVIRDFMRAYIARHYTGMQPALFETDAIAKEEKDV